MTETTEPAATARWPIERFYWALLDAPGWRAKPGGPARPLPPGLLGQLADEVPEPVDQVWAVGVTSPDGRVVVCAARREELLDLDAAARTLVPAALPGTIDGTLAEASSFNLLVGEFEPAMVRRERWRRHRARAVMTLVIAALVSIGLWRRADHWSDIALRAKDAQARLANELLGPGVPPPQVNLELRAEIDRLRELARARPAAPRDAALQLAALLRAWPTTAPSKPQSVSVSESGTVVSVSVAGDPTPFLSAFKVPDGWTLDEPRLNQAGEVTRLTLHLRPKPPPGGTSP